MKVLQPSAVELTFPIELNIGDENYHFEDDTDLMPIIQFDSRSNPFWVMSYFCRNPVCPCTEIVILLIEIIDSVQQEADATAISFALDWNTWQEIGENDRSESEHKLVDEFISDLNDDLKKYLLEGVEISHTEAWKRIKDKVSVKQVRERVLLSFEAVIGEQGSLLYGGRGFSFVFMNEGRDVYVEDLYCLDPQCECNETCLVFYEISHSRQALAELFRGFYSFQSGFEIEELFTCSMPSAKKMYQQFARQDADLKQQLKNRYLQMKEVGKRLLFGAGFKKSTRTGEIADKKISRNAPCPCGSGKKYKKCCGINE